MEFTKDSMQDYLLYDTPYKYNDVLTIYPITMANILSFNKYQKAFMIRKNAIFTEKKFIKMSYYNFIKYASKDFSVAEKYNMPILPFCFKMSCYLLTLMCGDGSQLTYDPETLDVWINDFLITDDVFDDLRRIFIIQNDVDFDIDEFMNIDAINALEKAREHEAKKHKSDASTEDYIDSLAVALHVTNDYIKNLTIRKFWRYIRRIQKHEEYQACHTGEMGGFVKFKEPLQHWMTSMEVVDKYENLKTNEDDLRSKIEG